MAKTTAADLVRARATSEEITAERNVAEYGERSMFVEPYAHAARVCRELAAQIDALPAEPVGVSLRDAYEYAEQRAMERDGKDDDAADAFRDLCDWLWCALTDEERDAMRARAGFREPTTLRYDAALRVAEAVRDACADEMVRTGGFNPVLPAIVRATLGANAVARAEREVLRLAVDSANREPWCLSEPPCGACDRCAWLGALAALTVAREEAGKR